MNLAHRMLVVALALLSAVPAARAQNPQPYPGGVTLFTRDFDPANPGQSLLKPVFGDPTLLRQVVNTAWQASRASISDQIIAQMGQANSVAKGVTPYNIICTMGQPGDLSVVPGRYANGSTLQMKYLVRGNYIEFDTTQPTALGKWADPRFSCSYDLGLTLSLQFGEAPGPLRMTSVKAQVSNSKLDSHGLIADLVFIGNDVTKLFGTNYIKKAQTAIDGKNFDFTGKLNQGLAPFNAMLAQFGGQGYALADSILNAANGALPGGLSPRSLPGAAPQGTPQGPQLLLFMDKEGAIPTRGTGEISGAIKWKKALGEPSAGRDDRRPIVAPGYMALGRVKVMHPYARGFRIRAVAQSGFGREGTFVPPMTEVGVLQSVTLEPPVPGRDGTAPGSGDEYVLHYVIAQLPLNIPIKVEAAMSAVPWNSASGAIGANQSLGIGPSGWSGVITLKPGRPGISLSTKANSGIGSVLRAATAAGGTTSSSVKRGIGERSIIIVGGTPAASGAAASGAAASGGVAPGTREGIIIVSGKEAKSPIGKIIGQRGRVFSGQTVKSVGDAVALNPQPLPPVEAPSSSVMRRNLPASSSSSQRAGLGASSSASILGGYAQSAPATSATLKPNINLGKIIAEMPKAIINNPSGTLAVGKIDFEVGLINGPR